MISNYNYKSHVDDLDYNYESRVDDFNLYVYITCRWFQTKTENHI